MQLKGGVCNFSKTLFFVEKKFCRGRVPKQNWSQSAVRGMSTQDVEERAFLAFSEQPSDRKIEMADKKQKRKTSAER